MAVTVYKKTAITGGAAGSLDSIDGAGLLAGDFAFVTVAGLLYIYILDETISGAESSPTKITPDANAGTKRWILQTYYLLDGLTSSMAELNLLDGSVAGTAVASKALVLGADKNVDTLSVADSGFKLGVGAGTAVTSTAAELNLLDGSVAGTAVASKALVLGADKNVDTLSVADSGLRIGAGAGTAMTATAAELNKLAGLATTAAELGVLSGIPGTLTAAELGYIDGATSSIQTQMDLKAPKANPVFTGVITDSFQDLTASGAITSSIVGLRSSSAIHATLAAPVAGQRCTIICVTVGGSPHAVTLATGVTFDGTNNRATITSSESKENYIIMVAISTVLWQILSYPTPFIIYSAV